MPQINREENILEDVLGLRSIPQNPIRNRIDLAAIPTEEECETIGASLPHVSQQRIVCERFEMLVTWHRGREL
jgi:hypothetical protein